MNKAELTNKAELREWLLQQAKQLDVEDVKIKDAKNKRKSRDPPPERLAYTFDEFCQAHSMSRAHLYNLIKRGEGPEIMRAGKKVLITAEAAAAWRAKSASAA
jgi:hypothetical protein